MKTKLRIYIYTLKLNMNYKVKLFLSLLILYLIINYQVACVVYNGKLSFYDIFYWHISDCQHLALIHSTIFLLIIHRLVSSDLLNLNYILKYKNRYYILVGYLLYSLIASLCYVMVVIFISFIQSLFDGGLNFEWNIFLKTKMEALYRSNPTLGADHYISAFLLNLILFFFSLGLLYIALKLLIERKSVVVTLCFLNNILNYALYLSRTINVGRWGLIGNVSLGFHIGKLNTSFNINYWLEIIFVLLLLSFYGISKKDLERL